MWVPAAYVLLLLACSEDGKACSPRIVLPGFVSEAACKAAAQSLGPALKALDPGLRKGFAACVRGKEEQDA